MWLHKNYLCQNTISSLSHSRGIKPSDKAPITLLWEVCLSHDPPFFAAKYVSRNYPLQLWVLILFAILSHKKSFIFISQSPPPHTLALRPCYEWNMLQVSATIQKISGIAIINLFQGTIFSPTSSVFSYIRRLLRHLFAIWFFFNRYGQ